MNEPSPEITILLLGDDSCGKSTFLSRLSLGHDPKSHHNLPPNTNLPTLHDISQPFIYNTTYFNRPYLIKLFDNDTPEEWRLLRPDIVVLCFDIGNPNSLEALKRRWLPEVSGSIFMRPNEWSGREGVLLVLGLKRDLRDRCLSADTSHPPSANITEISSNLTSSSSRTSFSKFTDGEQNLDGNGQGKGLSERFVIPQEGHRYAMEMRADGYMECSALTGELVWEVWEDMVRCGIKVVKGGDGGWGGCKIM